jgi:recombinational DNA repair ATPase RecF
MRLCRLEVEGGFVDGLEIQFSAGLNVLIGPRGAGKTSVIELIRYCLEAPALTERGKANARQHALSVLGSHGVVTLELEDDGRRFRISRAQGGDAPALGGRPPVVLSQSEVELIGTDPAGRLNLVDEFLRQRSRRTAEENNVANQIASATLDIQNARSELERLRTEIATLEPSEQQLVDAKKEQAEALGRASIAAGLQEQLDALSVQSANTIVTRDRAYRTVAHITEWRDRIVDLDRHSPNLTAAMSPNSAEVFERAALSVKSARERLVQVSESLSSAIKELDTMAAAAAVRLEKVADQSHQLRQSLEAEIAGSGAIARKLADLGTAVARLESFRGLANQAASRLEQLQANRTSLLDQLESSRVLRFESRRAVAARLRSELGPQIDVDVQRGAEFGPFASAIVAALRGTGLHYNTLAPKIAAGMSPREFVEAIERGDSSAVADLAEISPERAEKIIAQVPATALGEVLTAEIEDTVTLRLLSGGDYRSTDDLSTGQRCTVVLPIILSHAGRTILVDQPEDNLDNRFIVETLVETIRRRQSDAQIIVSTHNANIPVLGDASRVIALESDGRRGYVRTSGSLTEPAVVNAITSVMEGGPEAFKRRAQFYGIS